MKRCLTRILICLLLGVIINIAIAWGFWLWGERPSGIDSNANPIMKFEQVDPDESMLKTWERRAQDHWPDEPMQASRFAAAGVTYRSLLHIEGAFDISEFDEDEAFAKMKQQEHFWINEIDCGWPMRSLALDRWGSRDGLKMPEQDSNGWLLDTDPRLELPVQPKFIGMLVNTAFYALLILGVGFALQLVKAGIRRRRGHCPRCNFDLRHDRTVGCPECGWRRNVNRSAHAESSAAARRH